MIIQCNSRSRKFVVKDKDIPNQGREVKCGYCSSTWHQMPVLVTKNIAEEDKDLSIDNIKASDGKTYKFLGSQWAQLLPSGKTGIFAKKKIGKELDKLTGRKAEIINKKITKRREVNPSSEKINTGQKLPDIYKPKESLGFIGCTFLIIIIGFSTIGFLKTFENDLINYFPQTEYLFEKLEEQLVYIAETVKNVITIINDLINSY